MIFRQRGVSLMEVLIAMLLLTTAILGSAQLHVYMQRQAEYTVKSIQAMQQIDNKLESFRARSLTPVSGGIDFYSIVDGTMQGKHDIHLAWTVSPVTGELASHLKQITMVASWQDREGNERSIHINTLLSAYSEFD